MSQKIGIFAGTFDPVHKGHIAFAQAAKQSAGLDRIVFLPETSPRHKLNVNPVEDRLAQIQRQVDTIDGLEAIYINQAQFTISQTLPELARLYPSADFTLLIGSDIVPRLHYWTDFESLRENTSIVVGLRDGSDDKDSLANYLDTLGMSYLIITADHSDVSSTQIKQLTPPTTL